ncbi:CCA tRNA nucleotidyltransferase [Qipengyuania atrilutea]|uniref:CCA tRNA nucleotidyltransferase n=1 Tax=Qipengyuania atrilutea TaxID=2744473 RepID=A0A850H4V3_9SPHN|nr:CCA tRNA nucleotidyltransferase [Actirhodobacter atriluteus]NVD45686.1 CCA tRNA nucleotidyltransferase [Actirhodobacter atriluteus]
MREARILPAAAWTQRADLAQLVAALGNENMRWVGGAVRDTLVGRPVKDVDAATPLVPETVVARCKEAGIRTVPTGIDHGTVTAILPDGPVEITTLRRDVSTDGRRATIAFSDDWREDAARRDFTINALYVDPESLEIFDYFGGLADLEANRVRFIGDARQRIAEDHLRILRYFRFRARFGGWDEEDEDTESACRKMGETLKGLSRERVAMELLQILALPDPSATVRKMHELGVLPVILPEARKSELSRLDLLLEAEDAENAEAAPLRRLAALIPPLPAIAASVASRLRLSKAQRQHLVTLAERSPADIEQPRALAFREGMEAARDRLMLQNASAAALEGWDIPEFPLKGRDIIASGIAPGPDVARILREIQDAWVAAGFPGEEGARDLARKTLAKR